VASESGDVLMMIVGADGKGVPAECTTDDITFDGDDLMDDFEEGTFFEVEDWDFGINVEDKDEGESAKPGTTPKTASKAKFSRWMSMALNSIGGGGKSQGDAAGGYPVELEPFSFTRFVDKASPLLFNACSNKLSYKSAVVVKRKDIGSDYGLQTYFRIDFTDVLIISLAWDNGPVIKEKVKFICRQALIQYKQQKADGSLGAAISGSWVRKMETKA